MSQDRNKRLKLSKLTLRRLAGVGGAGKLYPDTGLCPIPHTETVCGKTYCYGCTITPPPDTNQCMTMGDACLSP
jgi:hypothetical protein